MIESLAWLSMLALLSIWVVYPLVIAALAALRSRTRVKAGSMTSPVSIVVATREPATTVVERVRDLVRTSFPADRLEIIVAHDRSVTDIDLSGPEFDGFRILLVAADEPGGKAATLNAGMRAASGDVVVFADSHQRYEPETIACLVSPFDDPGVGGVTGNYVLAEGAGSLVSSYWAFEKWLRKNESAVHSSVGATGAVWAMRRALWQPLPTGLILDDVWSPMRVVLAGYRVTVSEGALALETRRPAPGREYARKVRTLTGVIQLCVWLPALLVPVRNPIWAQFLFHKLLRMLTPYFLIAPILWPLFTFLPRLGPTTLLIIFSVLAITSSWIALSGGRTGTRLRYYVSEATFILLAIIVAGYNGLRRNWQVWN